MPFVAMLTLAMLAGQNGTAPPAAPLAPSGQWVAAFEESMCVLSRAYGTGPDQVHLGFKPVPGDERIEIVVLTPEAQRTFYGKGQATVALESGKPARGPYGDYMVKGDRRLVRVWVKLAEIGEIRTAKMLTIALDKKPPWTFQLKGTAKAMQVLDQCQDNLVRSWGFDPDVLRKQTVRATPITDPHNWISDSDYPQIALRGGQRGTVRLRYRVDKAGLPQECTILQSSGSALLDKTSCELILKRARFRPALGPDGQPEDDLRSETINWLLWL